LCGLLFVSRIGRKGVIVIPKAVREAIGLEEKSPVIISVEGDRIVIKPIRVLRVKASARARRIVEEALSEEYLLEEEKAAGILERG